MKDWAKARERVNETRDRDNEFHFLSFRLTDEFVRNYASLTPAWGFDMGGGNTLGEWAWYTKYSRVKADGTKERFFEGLRRVIEGMFSIQKDHALRNVLPWDEAKAHRSAQEAYERAFRGKWSPPGRGFWMMGTEFVNGRQDSSALQNCGFLSTKYIGTELAEPFVTLMNMSMLGVGVGFDTLGAGALDLHNPKIPASGRKAVIVEDSREGWCDATAKLLNSYFVAGRYWVEFDYSHIRPEGSPILGFGGTSAGPEPLMKLHKMLRLLLDNRDGEKVTSTDIVDIMNMIGKCVVAANVRSSAEIALGDPYDKEFLALKDWRVNPDRMGADGWGYTSNNSVVVSTGDDLSHLVDSITLNGEPGIYWMDVVRSHGRIGDWNDKDKRAMGVNPCQPEWSTVLTPDGVSTIGKVGIGDLIWSQDGWVRITRKAASGTKPVYRYRTTAGFVDATCNHRVVSNGTKVELRYATSVDRLRGGLDGNPFNADDVMAGLLLGDGYIHTTHGNPYHILLVGKNDQDYFSSEVSNLIISRHGVDSAWSVKPIIERCYLVPLPERDIPNKLLGNASVLRGLYSANGSVVNGRVAFKTTSPKMRDSVQLSLSALGIASYFTTNKPPLIKWPNGEYESRESYDINIGRAQDVIRFAEVIGFIQQYKMDHLLATVRKETGYPDKSFDIIRVESLGDFPVWDITVDGDNHTYWSGGMNVSNCGEQPLENHELCTLVETYPTNHTDLADYCRTLKVAYLYGKSVTLLATQWPKTNEVMIRNRRIGTSMTGIAQFVDEHGWAELKRWQNEGYNVIRDWDEIYSEWLGVRESIRVTTVKPSGTVSLLFGVTPGCHWPKESGYYVRTVRETASNPIVPVMRSAGYRIEPNRMNPDHGVVIYLPVTGPDMRSERDVSLWEKVALAAHCQKYWSDNSVSVTATFNPLTEQRDIEPILRVYDGQLKSLSFLPDTPGVYDQAPYIRVSQHEWQAMHDAIKPIDWKTLYQMGIEPEGEKYCSNDSCQVVYR